MELLKPTKAIVGSIIAGVGAFVSPVLAALVAGQPVTSAIWASGAVALLAFAGIAFPAIYSTTNNPVEPHEDYVPPEV